MIALGGVGLVGVTVGSIFGFRAKSQHDDATDCCSTSPCSDAVGVAQNDAAQTSALVADISFGLGMSAALGAGTILWLTSPRPAASSSGAGPSPSVAFVVPAVFRGGASASIVGRF